MWGMYRDWRVTLAYVGHVLGNIRNWTVTLAYVGHVVGNVQRLEIHISICRSRCGEYTENRESH